MTVTVVFGDTNVRREPELGDRNLGNLDNTTIQLPAGLTGFRVESLDWDGYFEPDTLPGEVPRHQYCQRGVDDSIGIGQPAAPHGAAGEPADHGLDDNDTSLLQCADVL